MDEGAGRWWTALNRCARCSMFALWLVLASVTACGGSGTSSVTCGPGTILVKDQCLPEGADGSPGDGGVDAKSDSYQGGTSSCSNPRVIAVENAVVEDFEMGARLWFSYQDGTGTLTGTTVNQGPTESNSAEVPGSQAAAHLVGSGFTDFGAGLGFSGWLRCVDLRAFAGISFWAKGGKGTGTSLADGPILDWLTPATLPVQFGGDCTTGCND